MRNLDICMSYDLRYVHCELKDLALCFTTCPPLKTGHVTCPIYTAGWESVALRDAV
jgi:hypothetical protein